MGESGAAERTREDGGMNARGQGEREKKWEKRAERRERERKG
jgi:hypothetical protein